MQIPNKGYFAKPLTEKEMLDAFEHAFLVMRHAIEKGVLGFTLSGLNKPLELTYDANGRIIDITPDLVHSHTRFLEQLFERIGSLGQNESLLATVRSFNDKTHYVRLLDLEAPGHIDEIAPQVFNLIECLQNADIEGATENLARELARVRRVLPQLVKEGIARAQVDALKPNDPE
jgi:DNA-binding GntR family transcriptional regulator